MAQGWLTTLYGDTVGVVTRLMKSETFAQPIRFLKDDEEGCFYGALIEAIKRSR
jgi:hypothetical protein